MSDRKTEPIKVWLDEATLLDLTLLANRDNRKLSEFIRHICRLYLYGHATSGPDRPEGPERPE